MSDFSTQSDAGCDDRRADSPIDIDLYCLQCGYNLRGLTGDPVRCPECGNFNPVALVEIPAEQIRAQLTRMETAPAVSVVGVLMTLGSLVGLAAILLNKSAPDFAGQGCLLTWLTLSLLILGWGVLRFRTACMCKPGWPLLLLRYQIVGVLLVAAVAIAYASPVIVASNRGIWWSQESISMLILAATTVLVVVGIFWGVPPVHRWLKRPMERMQREVAVTIARDRVRKQMMRGGPRWRQRRQ